MRLLCPLLLGVSLLAQPGQPQYAPSGKPGSVEGTVIDQVTQAPVRKAAVTIINTMGGYAFAGATDSQGKFRIDNADPGRYIVQNVVAQGYWYNGPRTMESAFTVNEEEHVTGIKVELQPFGVIAGKVVNEDGEPMRDVSIQAFAYTYVRGVKRIGNSAGTNSDDRGEFRLSDLRPGRYLVRAWLWAGSGQVFLNAGMNNGPPPPNTHSNIPETGYPYSFYPNTSDPAQATLVRVSPGNTTPGIDFQMRSVPVFHIRGRVAGVSQDFRPSVSATECSHGGSSNPDGVYNAPVDPGGAFDLPGLVPGTYCLSIAAGRRNAAAFARQTVTINDRSIHDVEVTLQTSSPVSGVVSVDGQSPVLPRMRLNLERLDGTGGTFGAGVTDGKFEIAAMPSGTYQILAVGLQPTMYLKSVQYNSQEAPTGSVAIGPEGGQISLLIGTDAGILTGTVQTESGDPAASVDITVAPDDSLSQRADLVKTGATDSKGSFQIRGLAPGNYKVYAWEDHDLNGLPSVLDFRKQFSSYAAAVVVSPGATASVQVKSIPAKETQPVKERF